MEYQDYYKILGVSKNADKKEIKSAYRKLARKYHPDVNQDDPQAEARLKKINEAYEVLSDPEKRATYDQLGPNWQQWQNSGQPGGFNWRQWANAGNQRVRVRHSGGTGDAFGGTDQFSEFFNSIFGDIGSRQGQTGAYQSDQNQSGQDIEHDIEISLTEAYLGTTRTLLKGGRRLEVKIPAGAQSGTKVRLRGQGQPGYGRGQSGDLYVKVKVGPDPRFERHGDNLYTPVRIDLYTAVLGGEVIVPTLSGDIRLKIPAGSQPGQSIRLRHKGMPKLRDPNQHGDLYARLKVDLPTELTPHQRELFEQLRRLAE